MTQPDENALETIGKSNRADLVAWMDALEFYARDWDESFGGRPRYFTQEFWYMLVGCLRADWAGHPLTVSQLAHSMKSGSNRTREERIKRAVDDGYLIKEKGADDGAGGDREADGRTRDSDYRSFATHPDTHPRENRSQ